MTIRLLAWAVHLYTATGLVLAAVIATLIVHGGDAQFRLAFLLMLAAVAIDASDGWLARRMRVGEVVPSFDGRRLDDITDFHTYTTLPLLLIWRAELLPAGWEAWLLLPLLASAYGFSQAEAKTRDGYFLGFPSYWNVIALYLYFLQPQPWIALGLLVGFALLTFVPSRYLYPSQPGRLNVAATLLGIPWAAMLVLALAGRVGEPRAWVLLSLYYPAFYLLASWTLSLRPAPRR
jgi:phosphatidylcholine synthase